MLFRSNPVLATVVQGAHLAALPKHLAAKVANAATGGTQAQVPAGMAGLHIVAGKPHRAKAPAEIAWATWLQSYCATPQPVAQVLAAGAHLQLGMHTVRAYLKRGWLVAA